jgi:hypothetical protein
MFIGGFLSLYTIDWFLGTLSLEVMEKATEKLSDAVMAWQEEPLSNDRIFYEGEFCYLVNNNTICPKRNVAEFIDKGVISGD